MDHLTILKDAVASGDTEKMVADLYTAQRKEPATIALFRSVCIEKMNGSDAALANKHRGFLNAYYDDVARGRQGQNPVKETQALNAQQEREFYAGQPKPEEA